VGLLESKLKNINIIGSNDDADDDADDNDVVDDDDIEIWFSQTVFDELVLSALEELFSVLSQARQLVLARQHEHDYEEPGFALSKNSRPIIISRLQLDRCEGNQYVDKCIKLALEFDVLEVLCVDGQVGSYDLLNSSPLVSSNPSSFPIHLKELDIRYFEISAGHIRMLRNGILNPSIRNAGGGLERLSCCNISFKDDLAVQEFAQVLSQLSQKPKGYNNYTKGRFLEVLWLYYCNLEDRHLQTIMKSLITVNVATNNSNNNNETETIQSKIRALSVADTKTCKDWPLRDIVEPLDTDVACGERFAHKGNARFFKVLQNYLSEYTTHDHNARRQVCSKVIREWRGQTPSGRFLMCDKTTGTWYDVGDEEAIRRIGLVFQEILDGPKQPHQNTKRRIRNEHTTTKPSTTGNASPMVVENTLKSLTIEQASCGAPFYGLLGAWLLNSETEFLSPTTYRSSCSLETVNIFIWEAVQTRTSTDPMEPLTRSLPWSNRENENENESSTNKNAAKDKTTKDDSNKTTNTILKKLCLSGVDNMEYLGRFVSEQLLGLESLQLQSHGSSDEGMNVEKFSRFVSASRGDEENRNRKPRNYVLRELSCHCSDKPTRLKLESCHGLENLLDRYPMLHDVKFGFKRNAYARQQEGEPSNARVQQMKNVNAGGRFLFVPTVHRPTGLPISLWPIVLAEFHKRNHTELDSLMDEDLQRWVESGSIGGDDMDDDLDSESEDENDDDLDDNDEDGGCNITMNVQPTKSSNEDPRVMEKTASAIYGLLRPNMEHIRLLALEQRKPVASRATNQILQSSQGVMRPPPIPARNVTLTDSESIGFTNTMVENPPRQNKRRKVLRAVSGTL